MTDLDLRELLHERVADETAVDLSARAWRRGRAVRRRRSLAVVGGVVAGSLAASGVVAWVDSTPPPPPAGPLPQPSITSRTSSVVDPDETTPDGTLGALPVYLGPTLAEEGRLPAMAEDRPPLPQELRTRRLGPPSRVEAAVAAIGTTGGVFLLGADGSWNAISTENVLTTVGDADGNYHSAATARMLAPDGAHLAFPQGDHLVLFDLAAGPGGEFQRVDLPAAEAPYEWVTWTGDRTVLVHGDGVAAEVDVDTGALVLARRLQPLSPLPSAGLGPRAEPSSWPLSSRTGARVQAWFTDQVVSGAGAPPGPPELLVVEDGGQRVVLAVPDSVTATPPGDGPSRHKLCCPPAAWVAPGVPAYLSRSDAGTRLIAWHPGTHRFEVVTEITGRGLGEVSLADFS